LVERGREPTTNGSESPGRDDQPLVMGEALDSTPRGVTIRLSNDPSHVLREVVETTWQLRVLLARQDQHDWMRTVADQRLQRTEERYRLIRTKVPSSHVHDHLRRELAAVP
jgi:hypothetical protein